MLRVASSMEFALFGCPDAPNRSADEKRCLPNMFTQPTQSAHFASFHLFYNAPGRISQRRCGEVNVVGNREGTDRVRGSGNKRTLGKKCSLSAQHKLNW